MNSFTLLNPDFKDEDDIIHFYGVSASIVDFHGDKSYKVDVYKRNAKILKEKEDRIQFLFNNRIRRTITKKHLSKNEYGEVFGFNGYGIGSALNSFADEVDLTIDLCIGDLWKKIFSRNDVPDWVFEFKGTDPVIYREDLN